MGPGGELLGLVLRTVTATDVGPSPELAGGVAGWEVAFQKGDQPWLEG